MADVAAIYHWTDGDTITAARLNTVEGIVSTVNADFFQKNKTGQTVSVPFTISDAVTISNGYLTHATQPRCRAEGGAVTGTGAEAFIAFGSTNFDVGDLWVIGSPTRLTVPASAGGLYLVTLTGTLDNASTATSAVIRWRRNVSDYVLTWDQTVPASGSAAVCCTVLDTVVAADYFRFSLEANSNVTFGGFASVVRIW